MSEKRKLLQGLGSNQRSPSYEHGEIPLLHPTILKRIFFDITFSQFHSALNVLRVISLSRQLYIYSHPEMNGIFALITYIA